MIGRRWTVAGDPRNETSRLSLVREVVQVDDSLKQYDACQYYTVHIILQYVELGGVAPRFQGWSGPLDLLALLSPIFWYQLFLLGMS